MNYLKDIDALNVPLIYNPFIENLLENNNYSDIEKKYIKDFKENGYIIINLELEDEFIKNLIDTVYNNNNNNKLYNEDYFHYNESKRIIHEWENNKYVKELALNKKIMSILELLYGKKPFPHLTINFNKGSEQPLHSDTIHFDCIPHGWMAVAWIALQDIDETCGPITYIPKSHLLPNYDYTTLKLKSIENDDKNNEINYNIYNEFIEKLVEVNNFKKCKAILKKGDAIIWDSKLLHGGSKILDENSTRYSQVQHYFFEGCGQYYHPMWSDINKGIFAKKWCSEEKNISNCDKR